MYQILSQSVRFCRLYIKKQFGAFFFGSQCIHNIQTSAVEQTVSRETGGELIPETWQHRGSADCDRPQC